MSCPPRTSGVVLPSGANDGKLQSSSFVARNDIARQTLYTRRKLSNKPVILVVDDDQPILALMRNVLREFGMETRTASSGTAAVSEVRSGTPDVVLLDKNMPGESADEVIRSLRSEPGMRSTPILILSGEPLDSEEVARLGASGAVMKPFDIGDLIERIRTHAGVAR